MLANKKNKRKRKVTLKRFLLIFITVLIVSTFGAGYLYFTELRKPLYISPVTELFTKLVTSQPERNNTATVLESQLQSKRIDFETIEQIPDGYIVKGKDGTEMLFSSKKDLASQISSLQFILSRLTMEGKLFSRLDLRFEKPVIVLK